MQYPSQIAESVATEHKITRQYSSLAKFKTNGNINKSSPVSLFKFVCRGAKRFLQMNTKIILAVLITAMVHIHNQAHFGTGIIGSSFIIAAAANTKSAIVSSFAPNSLSLFVFRATMPSVMSLRPQMAYAI